MKLILSGGGSIEQTKELDKFFISLLSKNKKVLYIPIAKKTRPLEECLEWIKKCLNAFGFNNIKMWANLKGKKIEDVKDFGAIYIGGGNTYSLLKDLKEMGFIDILREYIKKGGVVYGGSAGAAILGKNIITVSFLDDNKVNLKDLNALNLIKDYCICCHYEKSHDQKIKNIIDKFKIKAIALPEGCGLYVEDNKIIVKGKGSAFVFEKNKKREIRVNEKV